MDAKTCDAQIGWQGLGEFDRSIIKELRHIGDGLGAPVLHEVDDDGALEQMTGMEELQAKDAALLPQRGLGRNETDLAPPVEIELRQLLGKRGCGGVVLPAGELARALEHILEPEGRRLLGRGLVRPRPDGATLRKGGQPERQTGGGCEKSAEERTTGQTGHGRIYA